MPCPAVPLCPFRRPTWLLRAGTHALFCLYRFMWCVAACLRRWWTSPVGKRPTRQGCFPSALSKSPPSACWWTSSAMATIRCANVTLAEHMFRARRQAPGPLPNLFCRAMKLISLTSHAVKNCVCRMIPEDNNISACSHIDEKAKFVLA